MRAVTCTLPGTDTAAALTFGEVPTPVPGPGEILVGVAACAVCRTDLQLVSGDLPARRLPIIPGHQVVGEVIGFGPGERAAHLRLGQRVGLVWLADACGTCRFCLSGRENLCPGARFTGWDRDGGWAAAVTARAEFVYRLDLPTLQGRSAAEIAPLLCGGVIGYRSLRVAGAIPQRGQSLAGMRLGLFGFGASATTALQLARHFRAEVYVVTRAGAEVERALALGADWAGTYDQQPPHLLDAAITFAPSGEVVLAALRACDRGGTVAINAIHLDGIPAFDYDDLWLERSLRSVANVTRADVAEFLELVGPAGITTQSEELPLDSAGVALERLRAGQVRGAFVLVP
ncbi:MAG: zinc-binding alcohol dehydrogenase family protein [Candidatus Nanopelagicales bacterium]